MSDSSINDVTNKNNDSNKRNEDNVEIVPKQIKIEAIETVSEHAINNNKSTKKEDVIIINDVDEDSKPEIQETKIDMQNMEDFKAKSSQQLEDIVMKNNNRKELEQVTKATLEEVIYQGEKSSLPVPPRRKVFVWCMRKQDIQPIGEPLQYEPESRNGFVLLVLMLVMCMLVFVFAFVCSVYFVPMMHEIFTTGSTRLFMLILAMAIIIPMNYVMVCSNCSRVPPCNFVCLALVTFGYALVVAISVALVPISLVMTAVGITLVVIGLCVCLALTSFDFTKLILLLMVASLVVMLCMLAVILLRMVFNIYFKPVHIAILVVACLTTCLSFIIELQMIIGGRSVELGTDDYALGAYMVFTSVVTLFLNILHILNLIDM